MIVHVDSNLVIDKQLDNTLQKNIQFINDSGPPPTLLPTGTYVDITTPAQGNFNRKVLSRPRSCLCNVLKITLIFRQRTQFRIQSNPNESNSIYK